MRIKAFIFLFFYFSCRYSADFTNWLFKVSGLDVISSNEFTAVITLPKGVLAPRNAKASA
jgi:hypothetical protein